MADNTRKALLLDNSFIFLGFNSGSLSHHGRLVRSTISRAATGRYEIGLKTPFWKGSLTVPAWGQGCVRRGP
jgi:hypothetical protein